MIKKLIHFALLALCLLLIACTSKTLISTTRSVVSKTEENNKFYILVTDKNNKQQPKIEVGKDQWDIIKNGDQVTLDTKMKLLKVNNKDATNN